MSVSKTSICNKALRKLGANAVINVDTDDSKEATLCKAAYDDLLLEILRTHNWNFALFRQSLNLDGSGSPAFGFSNRFILPTIPVFIRLIEVENNPEFRIENNFLLTNESSVNIRFVGKETDPNKYDPIFINCFAARIAGEIGYSITSDKALVTKAENEFIQFLSLARERDNLEDNDIADTSDSFSLSRIGSINLGINVTNA